MSSNRNLILFLLTVVYAFNFVDRQILGILAPYISKELNLTDTDIGLLTGFYFALFYTVIGIPIGLYADRMNRVNIVSCALAIWSAFTAMSGLAGNYLQLALARMGVGIGEAGGSPPSHSIISDLYPPNKRAAALAIYSLGIPVGIMSAYFVSAFLLDGKDVNWRFVFIVIGVPGVLFALLLKIVVKEPERGSMDAANPTTQYNLSSAISVLIKIPSYWYMCLGISFASFMAYATTSFQVTYFVRQFPETSITSLLITIGCLYGALYTIGIYLGGKLADFAGTKTPSGYAIVPAIAVLLMTPMVVLAFRTDNITVAYVALGLVLFFGGFYLGPSFSIAQSLAPIEMRSTSTAIFFFVLNIISLGGGPYFAGKLSDYLAQEHGEVDGLGLALSYTSGSLLIAFIFFVLAARSLPADWQRSGLS